MYHDVTGFRLNQEKEIKMTVAIANLIENIKFKLIKTLHSWYVKGITEYQHLYVEEWRTQSEGNEPLNQINELMSSEIFEEGKTVSKFVFDRFKIYYSMFQHRATKSFFI